MYSKAVGVAPEGTYQKKKNARGRPPMTWKHDIKGHAKVELDVGGLRPSDVAEYARGLHPKLD